MKTEKVSIIVPVYNTSKYLKKCISSLIHQTYSNIEIILVNDGSTDNSLSICKKYSALDNRIILIDKENEGVEIARSSGFAQASGIWITYVDSDDYIPENAIEILISKTTEDIDVVQGSKYRIIGKNGLIKKAFCMENKVIEHTTLMSHYFKTFFGDRVLPVDMWAKLYRKEMLDGINIKNTELSHGEDLCYNLQVFPYIRKMAMTSDIVYFYRWGGMTERMNVTLFAEARKAYVFKCEALKKYAVNNGIWSVSNELKEFFVTYIESYMLHTSFSKDEIVQKCLEEWNSKENLYAVEILRSMGRDSDQISEFYLDGKISDLYDALHKRILRKKIRCKVLKIINNL